jgi:hypothetical protein
MYQGPIVSNLGSTIGHITKQTFQFYYFDNLKYNLSDYEANI